MDLNYSREVFVGPDLVLVQSLVPDQDGSKSPLWILKAQTEIRLNMVQILDLDLRPSGRRL